jgi:hypothetical protein
MNYEEEKWNKWFSKNVRYGFKEDEKDDRDFLAGTLPKVVLQPDGQWTPPEFERQAREGLEVYGCLSFGVNSIVEMLHNVQYRSEPNYSDRFLASVSGTTIGGNTPRKVYSALRESGALPEEDYPYVYTWNEYYQPIPAKILRKAKKWTDKYQFNYEKITKDDLKEYLQYSPIGCSVSAWHQKDGLYYKPEGAEDNHFVILIGYEDASHWLIFDTYDEETKRLVWDYDFGYLARYTLNKAPKVIWYKRFIQSVKNYFSFIFA